MWMRLLPLDGLWDPSAAAPYVALQQRVLQQRKGHLRSSFCRLESGRC